MFANQFNLASNQNSLKVSMLAIGLIATLGLTACGKGVPEAGGLGVVSFAGLGEESLVLARGDDFAGDIVWEFGDEDGVGELLHEDR